MCVPIDDPRDAARHGRAGLDPFLRLRAVADSYGLPAGRAALLDAIADAISVGDRFIEQRLREGDGAFEAMWTTAGGHERATRRRDWFVKHRKQLLEALDP